MVNQKKGPRHGGGPPGKTISGLKDYVLPFLFIILSINFLYACISLSASPPKDSEEVLISPAAFPDLIATADTSVIVLLTSVVPLEASETLRVISAVEALRCSTADAMVPDI